MYKELATIIRDAAMAARELGDTASWRVEGLHIIAGDRLDILCEGEVISQGNKIYPPNEEPYFVEESVEISIDLCDAFYTNGDEKFIDLTTLQNEVELIKNK